jgi:hypothetical protein
MFSLYLLRLLLQIECVTLLTPNDRISATQLHDNINTTTIVDVRPPNEYAIGHLKESISE